MSRRDTPTHDRRRLIGVLALVVCTTGACGWVGRDLGPTHDGPSAGRGGAPEDAAVIVDAEPGLDGSRPTSDAAASDGGADSDGAASDASDPRLDGAAGVDAAEPDAALVPDASSDSGMDAAMDAGPACDLTGVWATAVDVQLSWPATILAGGSGTLRVWTRMQITQQDGALQVSIVPCNALVPDFALNPLIATEAYGLAYPQAVFDQVPSTLQVASSSGTIMGTLPSVSVTVSNLALMLGATLANPLTDSWPVVGSVMQSDDDVNGKPAVDANGKSGISPGGAPYSLMPLDLMRSARADIVYLAARLRLSSNLTLTSCSAGSGSATVTAFDTHIVGCRVASTASDCAPTQRDFVDAQRPAYSAGTATQSIVRLTSTTSCADVRAALP